MDDAGGFALKDARFDTAGWIPSQFAWVEGRAVVRWVRLGETRLLDPFYEQTMQRVMMQPFHQLFRLECGVETMVDWMEGAPTVPLAGLIFHMSRCGSTLMGQMLGASEKHIVASEPAPLDGVLRAHLHTKLERATQVRWVRGMVAALGQARMGGEEKFFIKLDCWDVHQAGLLREAFPEVPFVFLYREPVEVMVSHAQMPAAWTVPGMLNPLALLLERRDWDPQRREVYCARALQKICEGGLRAARKQGAMLLNYEELPLAMFGRVLRKLGLGLEVIGGMMEKSQRDAKSPGEVFVGDSAEKREEASVEVRGAAEEYLRGIYGELERERVGQVAGGL